MGHELRVLTFCVRGEGSMLDRPGGAASAQGGGVKPFGTLHGRETELAGAIERMPKLIERGIGAPGEFELNLGDHIGNL
jgi:hypothetical protein